MYSHAHFFWWYSHAMFSDVYRFWPGKHWKFSDYIPCFPIFYYSNRLSAKLYVVNLHCLLRWWDLGSFPACRWPRPDVASAWLCAGRSGRSGHGSPRTAYTPVAASASLAPRHPQPGIPYARTPGRREIEQRFTPGRREIEKRFTPGRREIEQRFTPARREIEQRFTPARREIEQRLEQRFTPGRREIEQRFTPGRREIEQRFTPGRREIEHILTPRWRKIEQGFTRGCRKIE